MQYKTFPQAISDYARGTNLEKNKISVLLMTSGMLQSKVTMDHDYDQTLFGIYSNPYDILKETKPIVIIDEPHKFKKDNKAYIALIEKINPLCVIRFGATFPNIAKSNKKDYNNLIFNLTSCKAFNNNLVKGVATQMIEHESLNDTKIKLMDIKTKNPKSCIFRNEKTLKSFELNENDLLSVVSHEFNGISIQSIGKTEDEDIKTGVTLSNGQILMKGDQIYAGIYDTTYQELMIKQAVKNHIKQERENFNRRIKIKTLSLFFIDSITSYRGEDGNNGSLRNSFQNILKEELEKELENAQNEEYKSYIKASLKDLNATNGGYFAEDKNNSNEEIQKEMDQILKDKESLISLKDEKGNWNTRRFIFSKWTLREGWDNPNVFQICKLRSSGSEISKLQEVGRGLRLPVDEYGNRISDEQFYLTYLYDYSEKDFAKSLIDEINKEADISYNIKDLINEVAKNRGIENTKLMGDLLLNEYIDIEGNINLNNKDNLFAEYPEFNKGLEQNKIIDKNNSEKNSVGIRKDKFNEIKNLWKQINKKYYLSFDEISEDEIYEETLKILNDRIEQKVYAKTIEKKTVIDNEKLLLKESIISTSSLTDNLTYGDFLKQIQKATGISIIILHKALCKYNETHKLEKDFFNRNTITKFIQVFQKHFTNLFKERYSYKVLDIDSKETALTDIYGNPKDKIIQGVVGIMKDDTAITPNNFLYDKVIFDSPKEKENIKNSNIDEVIVFGKIPRRSIQVPLYFGGTTSPDFMYVIKKDDKTELNFIIETKDIDNDFSLREIEKLKIDAAKKFFNAIKENNINVSFSKQIKTDDITTMIKDLLK